MKYPVKITHYKDLDPALQDAEINVRSRDGKAVLTVSQRRPWCVEWSDGTLTSMTEDSYPKMWATYLFGGAAMEEAVRGIVKDELRKILNEGARAL